jgi:hypothetical protein
LSEKRLKKKKRQSNKNVQSDQQRELRYVRQKWRLSVMSQLFEEKRVGAAGGAEEVIKEIMKLPKFVKIYKLEDLGN